MLCGTFKRRRRHPGDEYRLVRSNTMPRIMLGARDVSLVPIRRTKSTRIATRSIGTYKMLIYRGNISGLFLIAWKSVLKTHREFI
ncbi:hypothetical protein ACFW04_005048 [Cataglyphis niger]